jgi:hypothetical protein
MRAVTNIRWGCWVRLSSNRAGSRFLSPFTGEEMKSGWEAMIDVAGGSDFREFVIFYHEAGDETFRLLDRKGDMLPQRDAHTDTYRPAARLLNYRSEPHGERLEMQEHLIGFADESQGYGSYTFGDPATTIPRSYLGDPAKFRMIGGSEIVHSHHLHGGSIRWARQPGTSKLDPTLSKSGPVKFPPISDTSDRLDVQSIGPSEIYDQVIEGGSGGLQALAGEFVFHCHIPQHYVTGMWGFWRVYNTLQSPRLPDRCHETTGRVARSKRQDQAGDHVGQAGRHDGRLVRRQEVRDHQGQDGLEGQSREGLDQGLGRVHAAAARVARQDRRSSQAGAGARCDGGELEVGRHEGIERAGDAAQVGGLCVADAERASGDYVRPADWQAGVPLVASASWEASAVCPESRRRALAGAIPCP